MRPLPVHAVINALLSSPDRPERVWGRDLAASHVVWCPASDLLPKAETSEHLLGRFDGRLRRPNLPAQNCLFACADGVYLHAFFATSEDLCLRLVLAHEEGGGFQVCPYQVIVDYDLESACVEPFTGKPGRTKGQRMEETAFLWGLLAGALEASAAPERAP